MKIKMCLILILWMSLNLYSQEFFNNVEKRLPHPLNPTTEKFTIRINPLVTDTVHLLAVMVDFAIDQDAGTYGNGKFGSHYSRDYGRFIIDPLPHDRNYFNAHLEFLKNYYKKVSDGKVVIDFEVLDRIVNLPNVMSFYSPLPMSNDLSRLGILFEEVWKRVDSLYPNRDFTKYDVFTIFHAGVGRDIVIPETFGLEKDIPSVYLNQETLKDFFGENYSGVKIGNPPKYVLNSMILPETESREVETLTGKTLLELSINGLLAASFGSYLGLPDLFDSKTGKTAIGRFGLMDGQSMFAYAGLFPPEPSAWEKYFLGWSTPIEISRDISNINVFARLATSNNDNTLYKVPINSREYYLIENRQKDVHKDGIKIKSRVGVNLLEYNFFGDSRNFSSFYVDTVDGVVIDVDEFDWATPGNGILIWHIDEKIISENFSTNTINANPDLKGVRLIEADGIQDIGTEFTTFFGDVIVGEGDSVDFWFNSNPSKFYKNEFSDKTRPRTLSNNGSPTYVKIYNFSDIANSMSFSVKFGNDQVIPILNERISNSLKTEFIHKNKIDTNLIFIKSNSDFYTYNLSTKRVETIQSHLNSNVICIEFSNKTFYAFTIFPPTVPPFDTQMLVILAVYKDSISINSFMLPPLKSVVNIFAYKKFENYDDESNYVISLLLKEGDQIEFYLKDKNFYSTGLQLSEEAISSTFDGNERIILTKNSVYFGLKKINHSIVKPVDLILLWDNSLNQSNTERLLAAVYNKEGFFEILNREGSISRFKLELSDSLLSIAAGNLSKNETNYLIIETKDKIFAINKSGAQANFFPINSPKGTYFVGNLSLIDFNNDGNDDILAMTEDGRLICYSGSISTKSPQEYLFNYSIGYPTTGNYLLFNLKGTFLINGNDSGFVQLVQISKDEKKISWTHNSANLLGHRISAFPIGKIFLDEFLPKERVYNWPNPVYDNKTFFRVYVSEDAEVNIKIYDLSGTFVDEVKGRAMGGVDNEFVWNLNSISSGIYFARVEVNSRLKSDFKIIKVAVVK